MSFRNQRRTAGIVAAAAMLLPLAGCRIGSVDQRAERRDTAVAASVAGGERVTASGGAAGTGSDADPAASTASTAGPPTFLAQPDAGTASGAASGSGDGTSMTTEVSSQPATPAPTPATPSTVAPAEESATPPGNWDLAAERAVFDLLNERRAGVGLPPLASDPRLVASARGQVARMIATQTLAHQELQDDLDQGWSIVGENVGYGPDTLPIHQALVASPGHDANLVHTQYRFVGIGVEIDANGRMWVSQVFGG